MINKLILCLAFLLMGCNDKPKIRTGVIIFEHIGIRLHIYNPLYISTAPVKIHLSNDQIKELTDIRRNSKTAIDQLEEKYINAKFDRAVTDTITFSYLYKFIDDNSQFYTNSAHKNNDPSADSYSLNVNGKHYSIYYGCKKEFFYKLESYLKEKRVDSKVVEAISFLK
ncbi:hypothetical protein [Mucilaginibacter agri]|uniref:Lipoprotein n=1 Tax=Mucilaginibacter agri TaxID=2695265 RepID=A0A965ZK67_9SPHI|nr:hypothetical protein [Mucilaginibacter agri]NCD71548.1 hypothetical protein [Mucilaginibacter agri]